MKPIKPTDSRYFTESSKDPYIRHRYKVVDISGKFFVVDNWQDAIQIWWNTPSQLLSHIEVMD